MFTPKLIKVFETEKEYRADSSWNQSKLSQWISSDMWSWRKEFILGEDSKLMEKEPIIRGLLVDVLVQNDPILFDEMFYVNFLEKIPGPKSEVFVRELARLFLENKGELLFTDMMQRAYDFAEMKSPKFENLKFDGTELELFFNSIIDARGKISVPAPWVQESTSASDKVRNHTYTKSIYNFTNTKDREGTFQLGLSFEYRGQNYKALFDRVVINHKEKLIEPYDLKTSFAPLDFKRQGFLKRYYIQQGIYQKAAEAYRNEFYPDYEVRPFSFTVIDSIGSYTPYNITYEVSLGDEFMGFESGGRTYKGIDTIIDEITWTIDNDAWGSTKQIFESGGNMYEQI